MLGKFWGPIFVVPEWERKSSCELAKALVFSRYRMGSSQPYLKLIQRITMGKRVCGIRSCKEQESSKEMLEPLNIKKILCILEHEAEGSDVRFITGSASCERMRKHLHIDRLVRGSPTCALLKFLFEDFVAC